jgi:uncharacterized protein (DUF1697 family)
VKYLALLRGINVGGKNLIRMDTLRSVFEQLGFRSVTTYIQSGNVLFDSRTAGTDRLSDKIEKALATECGCPSRVVVLSGSQLETVVRHAPPNFGAETARYRYDVAFLKPPASAREILPTISLKDGVDEAWEANGVLYFSRLTERLHRAGCRSWFSIVHTQT